MQYLTIDELKKQCNIDTEFTDDDEYLVSLGDTAETLVSEQVNLPLDEIVAMNDGVMPSPLKHAMKLIVEYFYDNRGSDSTQIPDAYKYMTQLYRNYR